MKREITEILNSRPQHCIPASAAKVAAIMKLLTPKKAKRRGKRRYSTRTPTAKEKP